MHPLLIGLLVVLVATIALLAWMHLRRPAARRYALDGTRVLITGGNSGIGRATATALARDGAEVIITARDAERGATAVDDIRAASGSDRVSVLPLDLGDTADIRAFATSFTERYDRLDVLVNNAGLISGDRCTTADGFELTFGVNHLGPFLLTHLLLDLLRSSAPSRIVNVASTAHKGASLDLDDLMCEDGPYVALSVYGRSKLANVLFTRELARRLEGTGVTANAVHPGTVRTGFGADGDTGPLFTLLLRIARPFFLSPEQGARTPVHVAASPDLAGTTGAYFDAMRPARTSAAARDDDLAAALWERSEQLLGLDAGAAPGATR